MLGFITAYGVTVRKPESVSVALSSDNVSFTEVGERRLTPKDIFREGTYVNDSRFGLGTAKAKYVRITAHGAKKCPPDHVHPGQEARVFFDEVIVEQDPYLPLKIKGGCVESLLWRVLTHPPRKIIKY